MLLSHKMKTSMKIVKTLFGILGITLGLSATAQTFKVLHNFNGSDGSSPRTLMLSGNTLYGTTYSGGSTNCNQGCGTVFKVNTDGTGFTTILSSYTGSFGGVGVATCAGLILSGNTLYLTEPLSGAFGNGAVFKVNTDGTGLTVLHSFAATSSGGGGFGNIINSDGRYPICLVASSNTLYGIADGGGSSGYGTVFSLALTSPQMAIVPSQGNVILTWPTNATGFTLQSTTNLASPAVWTTNSPAPVVVNGQNIATNLIARPQEFFRLNL